MFCTACGKEIESTASFCGYCGTPVDQPEPLEQQPTQVIPTAEETQQMPAVEEAAPIVNAGVGATEVMPAVAVAAEPIAEVVASAPEQQEPEKKRSKTPIIIIAVIIAILLVIGGIVGYNVYQDMQYKNAHKTYPVNITVSIDNFNPATSTPIPLTIDGTDFEGNSVHEQYLIDGSQNEDISYMRGEYVVTVNGSPIGGDGALYNYDGCTTTVTIDENGASGATLPTMTVVPVEDRTDEMVDEAATVLIAFGYDADKTTAAEANAKQVIADYIAEQERIAAEAAAAAERRKNDGTYTVKAFYVEYKGASGVEGGSGVLLSANSESDYITIKSFGGDAGFPAGTYSFRVANDAEMYSGSTKLSARNALHYAINTAFKSLGSTYGPQTDHGRLVAFPYGNSSIVTFTITEGEITYCKVG